eukprot:scaffold2566_cov125-Alexandrium_tamarense.AAC.20
MFSVSSRSISSSHHLDILIFTLLLSVQYFGLHCELDDPCPELIDDDDENWKLALNEVGDTLMSYMRPIYQSKPFDVFAVRRLEDVGSETVSLDQTDNATELISSLNETMSLWACVAMVYSGSRWFATLETLDAEDGLLDGYTSEYHAFWGDLYQGRTFYISDPTAASTPVGVDMYERVMDAKYHDYGPFGLLKPVANITGQGYFHCFEEESGNGSMNCTICGHLPKALDDATDD